MLKVKDDVTVEELGFLGLDTPLYSRTTGEMVSLHNSKKGETWVKIDLTTRRVLAYIYDSSSYSDAEEMLEFIHELSQAGVLVTVKGKEELPF